MQKEEFIKRVSVAIAAGKCDLFVGSGISSASEIPSWNEVIQSLANQVGGLIVNDHDDLPMLAQYIVNNNSGNRNILRNNLIDVFDKHYQLNKNHHAIASMKIKTIWTTNYDYLIESAFQSRRFRVLSSDNDIVRQIALNEVEVVKLHSCIRGDLDQIILTQEDYENFIFKKPAILQRLRNAMTQKSFLFVGYGYRDPNIRTVMIEAMKLLKDNTQEHFIILTEPQKKEEESTTDYYQRTLRFKLWIKELNRLGIQELLIQENNELPDILFSIVINSRGNTVFLTGSHKINENTYIHDVARELSKIDQVILVNGQSSGVGALVLNEFLIEAIQNNKEIGTRIMFFPNPYSANPQFSNNPDLIPLLKKERA
ncbi:MAG: SIR2 family protein [bacterium]|nr:SIR2 family protein [bacterium]